jgi:translocator assembly and maintenance protein 41
MTHDATVYCGIYQIFVVEDSCDWHRRNLEKNPSHYTPLFPLKHLPVKYMASITDNFGAGVWFNVDVAVSVKGRQRKIKYGIISTKTLLEDLRQWSSLYIAGRLHKPVLALTKNEQIEDAIRYEPIVWFDIRFST